MKVLVTGGGGFLGQAIVSRLVARGDEVNVLCRGDYPLLRKAGVRSIRGDVGDFEAVAAACAGQDVVFHVAAKIGYWGPAEDYYRTNVLGTSNILDACRRQGVGRLIFTSSPSVVFDGNDLEGVDESVPYASHPTTYYQKTKIEAEKMALAADTPGGLRVTALRPHVIWGPGDNHLVPRLIARARAGKLKVVGDGRNRVGIVYIDNAADAHIQAAQADRVWGNVYCVTDSQPVIFWDWVNQVLAVHGEEAVNNQISFRAAFAIGSLLEKVYSGLKLSGEPHMTRFLAECLAKSHFFDISAARRDFGYAPRISLQQGLSNLADKLRTPLLIHE